jgi:F-type H+-transporting ATPase subunit b
MRTTHAEREAMGAERRTENARRELEHEQGRVAEKRAEGNQIVSDARKQAAQIREDAIYYAREQRQAADDDRRAAAELRAQAEVAVVQARAAAEGVARERFGELIEELKLKLSKDL